jgi:hypothetical protein
MSIYDPTRRLPAATSVATWAAERLRADAAVRDLLAAPSAAEAERRVMAHRQTIGDEDRLPPRFLLVRELVQAGGIPETLSGAGTVRLQIVSECDRSLETTRQAGGGIDRWHDDIQQAVREALVGQVPDLPVGGALRPMRRAVVPARPMFADETATFYAISQYVLAIAPSSVDTL